MEEINDLIVVESLPVIKQQLQIISDEVDKEIKYALSLECSEETKTEVKNARARLNKINTLLDDKRKQVKKAILNPYEEFENIYNELVRDKLKVADNTLKTKINAIEEEQLKNKEIELREFAEEWFLHKYIDKIVKFEDIGLNITLSASMKSLKDNIIFFCERIAKDLELISLEEYKDEISIEYKNNLDFAQSKIIVVNRHKQLEEMKNNNEEVKEELEIKMVEEVEKVAEELTIPEEIEEEITISFTVTSTKSKLKELREWMKENEIKYE